MKELSFEIVYLKPEFTFSHEAAFEAVPILRKMLSEEGKTEYTDDDFKFIPVATDKIESRISVNPNAFAIVPISNSYLGDIYSFLQFCSYEKIAEIKLTVSFCLCSKSELSDIKTIATINKAYDQVKDGLPDILPNFMNIKVDFVESTAAAASMASYDSTVAAICSERAATHYKLPILRHKLEGDQKRVTTFYIFRNTREVSFSPSHDVASQFNDLIRGSHIYTGKHLNSGRRAFAALLKTRKKLLVKWGVDPLYESLHLGHLSNLIKLRDFLSWGHNVAIILGNFTGIIGDPSGNLTQRPHTEGKELDNNSDKIESEIKIVLKDYLDQVNFQRNAALITEFDLRQFLKWMRSIDIRNIIDRPDFKQRLDSSAPLSVAEFIYPLFQSFDSVHIKPDVEIGGVDQIWNSILIKDIMQQEGHIIPFILLLDEVQGIDKKDKMSAFEDNAIQFNESKESIENKIMNLPPDLLYDYYLKLTRLDLQEIGALKDPGSVDVSRWKERLVPLVLEVIGKE